MEELKDIIKENPQVFEQGDLPEGHRERFLMKVAQQSKRPLYRRFNYKVAAVITLFILVTGQVLLNSFSSKDYGRILEQQSIKVQNLAQQLDPFQRDMVQGVIDQLVMEAIPLRDQLPQELSKREVRRIKESYYTPKIEGMNQLRNYVAEMLEE